jgi:hypothetical protein
LTIVMATQMSRTMNACPPELALCDTTAVAPTPRAMDPSAVTVVATLRWLTAGGRVGGGPIWYPGGSIGPV